MTEESEHNLVLKREREKEEGERETHHPHPPTHTKTDHDSETDNSKPHVRLQYKKERGWGRPISEVGWETAMNSLKWGVGTQSNSCASSQSTSCHKWEWWTTIPNSSCGLVLKSRLCLGKIPPIHSRQELGNHPWFLLVLYSTHWIYHQSPCYSDLKIYIQKLYLKYNSNPFLLSTLQTKPPGFLELTNNRVLVLYSLSSMVQNMTLQTCHFPAQRFSMLPPKPLRRESLLFLPYNLV